MNDDDEHGRWTHEDNLISSHRYGWIIANEQNKDERKLISLIKGKTSDMILQEIAPKILEDPLLARAYLFLIKQNFK